MAVILFSFQMVKKQNGRSKLGRFLYQEEIFIYIKRPMLAKFVFQMVGTRTERL